MSLWVCPRGCVYLIHTSTMEICLDDMCMIHTYVYEMHAYASKVYMFMSLMYTCTYSMHISSLCSFSKWGERIKEGEEGRKRALPFWAVGLEGKQGRLWLSPHLASVLILYVVVPGTVTLTFFDLGRRERGERNKIKHLLQTV